MANTRNINNALEAEQPEGLQPPLTRLVRQLSISYTGPGGQTTQDDPDSYQGDEKKAYQTALVNDEEARTSGYAAGIPGAAPLPIFSVAGLPALNTNGNLNIGDLALYLEEQEPQPVALQQQAQPPLQPAGQQNPVVTELQVQLQQAGEHQNHEAKGDELRRPTGPK